MDEDEKGRHRSQNSEPALQAAMKRKRHLNDTLPEAAADADGDRVQRAATAGDSKQHQKSAPHVAADSGTKRAFAAPIPRRPRTGANRPRKVVCTSNDWEDAGVQEEAKVKPEQEDLDEEQMVAEALFDLANSVLPPAAHPPRAAPSRTPLLNHLFALPLSNSDTESDDNRPDAGRRGQAGAAARAQRPRKPREIRKIPPRIVEERPGPPVEQLRHRKIPPRIVEARTRPSGAAGATSPGGPVPTTSSDGYEPRASRDGAGAPVKADPDHPADPSPQARDRSRSPPGRTRSPPYAAGRAPASAHPLAGPLIKTESLFKPVGGPGAPGGPPGSGPVALLGDRSLLPHHLAYGPHSAGPPLPMAVKHEGGAPLFQHLPPGSGFSGHVPLASKHSSNFPLPPMAPLNNLAMSPTNPLFLSHLILNNHPLSRPTKDPSPTLPPGPAPPGHYPAVIDPSRVALLADPAAPPFPQPPQSSLKSLYKRCAFHVYIAHFIQEQHKRNASKDPAAPAPAAPPPASSNAALADAHPDNGLSKPSSPPSHPADPSHPHASRPPSGLTAFQPPATLPWKLEGGDPRLAIAASHGALSLKLDASGPPSLHPAASQDAPLFAAAHAKPLPTSSIPQSFHALGHISHFGPLLFPPASQAVAWPPRTLAGTLAGPSPTAGPIPHMQIPSVFLNPSAMQPLPPSLLVNGPAVHAHPSHATPLSSPHVTAAHFFPGNLGPWLAAGPQLGSPPGAAAMQLHRPDLVKGDPRAPGRPDLPGGALLGGGAIPVDPSDPMHLKALGAQIIPRMSIGSHPLTEAGPPGRAPADVDSINASRPPTLRS